VKPLEPVLTLHLFPEERSALLKLLASFSAPRWDTPTVCAGWSVKDVAAHLLADDLGRLSRGRDAYAPASFAASTPENVESQLLEFINRQNETWVAAARRLSPILLMELLRWSGDETQKYFESLDMFALGEPVSWAGPESAPVWLDIAREYTERWLHQAQVRDAVSAPLLTQPRLFLPVLDTFVRALPHTFRDVERPQGTHVLLLITRIGETGSPPLQWSLVREATRWSLFDSATFEPSATVKMDADTAWRLFTKGLTEPEALARTTITGDPGLGEKLLDTVSIIA